MSMRHKSCVLVAAGVVLVSGGWVGHAAAQTTEPGTIRIRGAASPTVSAQPLYVVEGVALSAGAQLLYVIDGIVADAAYYQAPGRLDSLPIESIEILKGTAATHLYGEAARNGVVVIRTRAASECPLAPGGASAGERRIR